MIRPDDLDSRHGRLVLLALRSAGRGGVSRVRAGRQLDMTPGETRKCLDELTRWGLLTVVGPPDARRFIATDDQLARTEAHIKAIHA